MRAAAHMQALQLTGHGLRLHQDYPIPIPRAADALIRVTLAGICNTDLQLLAGYLQPRDLVLGHEFTGVVEVCPGCPTWIGRRVVGEINIGCGTCSDCRCRCFNHCPQRTCLGILAHDGAFAEYVVLPCVNLHEVPVGMTDRVAVFTEPVAAALRIQEQMALGPAERVAVIGDGKLGLLIALTLQDTGCALHVFGRHTRKLDLLAAQGIAVEQVRGREHQVAERERHAFDVVVECAGSPSAYAMAQTMVRPLGSLVLKSTKAEQAGHLDLNTVVVNEIRVLGSRCGPFAQALAWLDAATRAGRFDVDSIIECIIPLHKGDEALAMARQSGTLKVLLAP